jgi:hypothetical protein
LRIAAVLAVMAVGLVLTSVTGSVHAQTNSAANNMTSAAKSMAGAAENKLWAQPIRHLKQPIVPWAMQLRLVVVVINLLQIRPIH